MEVLSIKDLRKSFGDKEVLKGLSLSVHERSIFGFVGKNGAGKTTTMRSILGLLETDGGEIYVSGERAVYGQTSTNRYVGYLPDVPEFYPFMTAGEYLRLCGECMGMSGESIRKKSDELLSLVGLKGETHRVKGFSRGMKQRLGIAQALLGEPKLLICDEPTSALDPIGRREILDILLSVKDRTTVLFSTHVLSDVERICTDVALINDGRIALQGSVDELKRSRRPDDFTVETSDISDGNRLLAAFETARRGENGEIRFSGGDGTMFAVLDFIKENRISVRKIEREEPSLESLFVEVVKQ